MLHRCHARDGRHITCGDPLEPKERQTTQVELSPVAWPITFRCVAYGSVTGRRWCTGVGELNRSSQHAF